MSRETIFGAAGVKAIFRLENIIAIHNIIDIQSRKTIFLAAGVKAAILKLADGKCTSASLLMAFAAHPKLQNVKFCWVFLKGPIFLKGPPFFSTKKENKFIEPLLNKISSYK